MTAPSDPSSGPPPLPTRSLRSGGTVYGEEHEADEWRRQHPAACVFHVLGTMRRMIFPIVAGVIATRGPFLFFFLGVMLIMAIGIALLRYWRYRYRLTARELVVEQGWLYRNVRHVAYDRVQNINITRNLLHRVSGVSGMQLESASGSEPEAVMDALSPGAIEALQERIELAKGERVAPAEGVNEEEAEEAAGEGGSPRPNREPRREILRLGVGELVRHGLVSNRGMVLVAALIGFFWQGRLGERYLPELLRRMDRFTERAPAEIVEALGPLSWFLFGVGAFLVIVMFLAILSVIYSIMRFYGFTLSVDSKTVRAEYGLFTRVAITIPRHRIQLIGFRANPFHRLCGRVSLRVETAGLTGAEESVSTLRWLAPILPEDEAVRVLKEVQPEVEWDTFEWRPLHPRTRVRMLRIRLVMLAVVTLSLVWLAGIAAILALLFIPLVLVYARGYFRYSGWAVTPTAIAFRSGWVVQQTSVVRYPKIQVLGLVRNPFDRRWGMASVIADTAGTDPTGHRVQIRFLGEEDGRGLMDYLDEKTRETKFVW